MPDIPDPDPRADVDRFVTRAISATLRMLSKLPSGGRGAPPPPPSAAQIVIGDALDSARVSWHVSRDLHALQRRLVAIVLEIERLNGRTL